MFRYSLLFVLLPVLFAPQQPGNWKQGADPIPDTSWRKSSGDFGAMMVITDRYKEFVQEWARPDTPNIHPVPGALRRGQSVVAVIIFTGCRPEKEKCRS